MNNEEFNNNKQPEEIEITVEIPNDEKPKKKFVKELFDWVFSIVVAIVAVIVINMFLFVQVVVDGSSMYPTLKDKDRLFATRFMYEPEVEDIVVIEPYLSEGTVKGKLMFGKTLYIKRVIATEGQTIDLKNGKVYIDGELYEEDYIDESVKTYAMSTPLPVTIPEDSVFVMGDNREHSKDSRDQSVGIIRNDQVVGKAVLRIFPFKSIGVVR